MTGSRIVLLGTLLCLGASVETAYRVREQIGVGPFGWRLFGGKFYGPSHSFDESATRELAAGMPVAVDNAFGDVEVLAGESGRVEIALRKLVYLGSQEKAQAFAQRVRLLAEVREGRLEIRTNRAELEQESDAFDVGFETHLSVRVPTGTAIAVKGSHGRATVEGAGETRIENDFGDDADYPVRLAEHAGRIRMIVDSRVIELLQEARSDLSYASRVLQTGRRAMRAVRGRLRPVGQIPESNAA